MTVLVLLIAAAAVSAADVTGPESYRGVWESENASMKIIWENADFHCIITWPDNGDEAMSWEYTAAYDPETGKLNDEGSGICSHILLGTESAAESTQTIYTDGAANFSIDNDGCLIWKDLKEDAGNGQKFVQTDMSLMLPTPEKLVSGYFNVIGRLQPGTAGASLKQAAAAYNAYKFAAENDIWAADIPALREAILTAWESMSAEDQKAFDSSFISILRLVNDCRTDWEKNSGVFRDAGVADEMEVLLQSITARVSWSTLTANTLTMGNTDGK